MINLLYDGDCPSCMKQAETRRPQKKMLRAEVEFLQKRMDENPQYQGLVVFTNLHDPGVAESLTEHVLVCRLRPRPLWWGRLRGACPWRVKTMARMACDTSMPSLAMGRLQEEKPSI